MREVAEVEAMSTKVVVLLGWPARSSLSPAMHEAGFRAVGLDWRYVPVDIPPGHLEAAQALLRSPSVVGANVTIPHKEDALAFVDALTPRASAAGALNTIVKSDGAILGENTDGLGLLRALAAKGARPEGRKVVLFGAGGAARGAAAALAQAGASELVVLNRSLDRAVRLADVALAASAGQLRARAYPWFHEDDDPRLLQDAVDGAGIVVNTTPVTRDPGASPIPDEVVDRLSPARDCVFCDMVYRPAMTRLLRQGQALGFRTVSGLEILLYQALPAFEAWTGKGAPSEVMEAALWSAAAAMDQPGGERLGHTPVYDGR